MLGSVGKAGRQGGDIATGDNNFGSEDDPFARVSVSYRGQDPTKAAYLKAKAQRCAAPSRPMRFLVIINEAGYLVAKPKLVGARADASAENVILAIQRCSPFTDAATPGAPRSYEIDLG